MKPIIVPLDWRSYADPRLLVDAGGATRDHYPTALEIPIDLHLSFDAAGKTNGIWCHYRKPFGADLRHYVVSSGAIVIYEGVGLLDRIEMNGGAPGPYEGLEAPLRAFLLYAKRFAGKERWPMIFSAEILNDYWKRHEAELRLIFASAPYR